LDPSNILGWQHYCFCGPANCQTILPWHLKPLGLQKAFEKSASWVLLPLLCDDWFNSVALVGTFVGG